MIGITDEGVVFDDEFKLPRTIKIFSLAEARYIADLVGKIDKSKDGDKVILVIGRLRAEDGGAWIYARELITDEIKEKYGLDKYEMIEEFLYWTKDPGDLIAAAAAAAAE